MGSQPLISVCIPCFNNEEFIACTIESVLNQSFENFELIIVDDKSTDRTVAVVRSFSDPRIRLLENQTNLGIGGNWNRALSCATGKYVKLLCGDDVLHPRCLSLQAAALELSAHAGVSLAICNRSVIDAENRIVLKRRLAFRSGTIAGVELIRKCVRRGANLIGEPVVGLFRKEALSSNRIYDPSNPYYTDLALWAELLKKGDAHIDADPLAAFRISKTAATTRIGGRQAACFRSLARELRKDPYFRISRLDLISGYALSIQWCILRNLFIRLHAGKAPRSGRLHRAPGDAPGAFGVDLPSSEGNLTFKPTKLT